MSAHKHADLIDLYAKDAHETETPWDRWQYKVKNDWLNCTEDNPPMFLVAVEYRQKPRKDWPCYQEVYAAWKDGELQEHVVDSDEWVDWALPNSEPAFNMPPEHYRRKPKPKTVDMYECRLTEEEFDNSIIEALPNSDTNDITITAKSRWTKITVPVEEE